MLLGLVPHLLQEVVVVLAVASGEVAVYLHLVNTLDVVRLVHLHNPVHQLLGQSLVWLVHAVLSDEHCGNELDAVLLALHEADGGVGHGFAVAVHHHVEIAAVHLINMVLLQKGAFQRVCLPLCSPVVDGILLRHLRLLAACRQQHYQKHHRSYQLFTFHLLVSSTYSTDRWQAPVSVARNPAPSARAVQNPARR